VFPFVESLLAWACRCAQIKSVEKHVMAYHPHPEEAIEAIKVLRSTADGDGNGYFQIDEFVDTIMGVTDD